MSILHKLSAAAALLVATASTPAHAGGLSVSFGFVAPEPRIVLSAPPPRPVVVRSAMPCAHAQWVDGQWSWDGYRWAWTDGYWYLPAGHTHVVPRVVVQRPVYVQRPVVVQRPVYVQRPVVVRQPTVVTRPGPDWREASYHHDDHGRGHAYGHDDHGRGHDDHGRGRH